MLRRWIALIAPLLVVVTCAGEAFGQKGGGGRPGGTGGGKSGGTSKPKDSGSKSDPSKAAPAEKPTTFYLGNANCPVDNKALANHETFATVDGQRVYVCSETCKAKVDADGKKMLETAYKDVRQVPLKGCIACAKPIDAGKATDVVFQGRKVQVCSDGCAKSFKDNPCVLLAQVSWPEAKDAKNSTDPIDGKPVDRTVLAIYKKHIIAFSSPRSFAAFEKDPDAALKKLGF
jgi:YHS domain-containing protein